MTETEYIRATNRVKISIAKTVLKDILAGEEYGISDKDCRSMIKILAEAEIKLFGAILEESEWVENTD